MRQAFALLALALVACGDGGPTAPRRPARTQIHFNTFHVEARSVTHTDFTVREAGTLIVVVDWTFGTNQIFTSLSTPSCDIYRGGIGCGSFFAQNTNGTKPAEFRYSSAIIGQSYRVYIANMGAQADSGVINVYQER